MSFEQPVSVEESEKHAPHRWTEQSRKKLSKSMKKAWVKRKHKVAATVPAATTIARRKRKPAEDVSRINLVLDGESAKALATLARKLDEEWGIGVTYSQALRYVLRQWVGEGRSA
jgi:ParB-like chromosome segregation protein Spo0J